MCTYFAAELTVEPFSSSAGATCGVLVTGERCRAPAAAAASTSLSSMALISGEESGPRSAADRGSSPEGETSHKVNS